MADENRNIEMDSKERVAFDLMHKIAISDNETDSKDREYWFKLYSNCYHAVIHGWSFKDIQERGE